MKETKLPVIRDTKEDYEAIEKRLKKLFRDELYLPLLKELGIKKAQLKNTREDLLAAIATGKIRYERGKFKGEFSSELSKELKAIGAKWKKDGFAIPLSQLPIDLKNALFISESRFQTVISRIQKRISQILPATITDRLNVSDLFNKLVWKTNKSFEKSIRGVAVAPKLTEGQAAKIAEEYTNNMKLSISGFAEKEIRELRKMVEREVFRGNRYEAIAKKIEQRYDVGKDKAKFLARQETNLLMSKFKESRYTAASVNEYRWGCVKMPHDKTPKQHTLGNVRYSHGLLEGKMFRWDTPPITSNPGEPIKRNNPGTDFNCRCFAIPIVRS